MPQKWMNSVDSFIRSNINEANSISFIYTDSSMFWLALIIFREVVRDMENY